LKPILDLANQDKIASVLKEVAEQIGWKGTPTTDSSPAKPFPRKDLQQALRQAKWWFDSLSQRFQSASIVPLQQGLNATGELFSPRWIATPTSTDTVTAMSMVHSGFCVSEGLADSVHNKLCQLTDAPACLITTNIESAILLLSAWLTSESRRPVSDAVATASHEQTTKPWAISRADCVRLPSESDVVELLTSMNTAGVIEVGASNACCSDDYQRAIAQSAGGIFRVVSDSLSHSANDRFSVPTVTLALTSFLRKFDDLPPDMASILNGAPSIQSLLGSGHDIVICSGNGWLGGPVCGIMLGNSAMIESLRKVAKGLGMLASPSTMAGLRAAVDIGTTWNSWRESPIGQIASNSLENLEHRAKKLTVQLEGTPNIGAIRVETKDLPVGPGLWTSNKLESACLVARHSKLTSSEWQILLAKRPVPIEALVHEGDLILVLRTISPADDQELVAALLEG